ncbi:uncharacterized protein LOC118768578 isoform X1 [Octopus sinensis]|uniref:Uncharacterized protein LOC118768578 isoform X1 n=1 Tax=Octopus sinensis TaxID=2607531 RepID=A0A7E6FUI4_9MOLL|nr:uncharacterized protein LOC118768578 isoform X1 [Octopus sinensis]
MFQFPSTIPTVTTVLLLTLTTILTVASNREIYTGSYKSLAPGYSYRYLQEPPTEQFSSTRCLLKCVAISLSSQSEFFTYNNVSRVCKNYSPKYIMTVVSTNDSNEMSFYRNSQWIKTYAISMGAGSKVYDSFLNIGLPSSWNVDECRGTFCPNFFRHPILDYWNYLPIEEVKLLIYKNKTDVVTIIFDGRNTTLRSWFSHEKLKNSPWNDLASATGVHLSIEGFRHVRRFYITLHGFCEGDRGWLTINEGPLHCQFEESDHYPSIRYSDTKSKVIWNNGYGLADSMAIFIRLRQQN